MRESVAVLGAGAAEPVTDILHGVSVADPYRWLEEPSSLETRQWISEQTQTTQDYFGLIPGREQIRKRVRELLAVETYDSLQEFGGRFVFRKRLPEQEQACIYMREGITGEDVLLIDPSKIAATSFTSVKPLRISPDGRFLLYEIKEGGSRTARFALFDIDQRQTVPDVFPGGYFSGGVFSPGSKSIYYVIECEAPTGRGRKVVFKHTIGTLPEQDREIYYAGEGREVRLVLTSDDEHIGFVKGTLGKSPRMSFWMASFGEDDKFRVVFQDFTDLLVPVLVKGKILAITDSEAPNLRIVEVRARQDAPPELVEIIPEKSARIASFRVIGERLFVSYIWNARTEVHVYDLSGKALGEMPVAEHETVRVLGGAGGRTAFVESESFTEPISLFRYSEDSRERERWAAPEIPFDSKRYGHIRTRYASKDGTSIPMFIVGDKEKLKGGRPYPIIMTAYGGYGFSMTPRFSVLVSVLMERGCLFALPNIRGGSEFGVAWHNAAKRRNRQTAIDDFLCAADWLVETGRTTPERLAIFGGSNAGLLVGAAMTQRPSLFRAVLCLVPLLDMLRYHLFDNSPMWRSEFGTAEDPDDFQALLKYSPYHAVQKGAAYPATLMVSGDSDGVCNPLHARKMIARLQESTASTTPILLDYSKHRGHSPVLPLSERIEALTNRVAFLCKELNIHV